jgi:threonine dehydratase
MNVRNAPLPTAADIDAAAARIAGVAVRTPLVSSPALDERLGGRIFLKAETLQRMGAFKFRGAYNKLASIPPERRAAGVVSYSSGNHAQGVAAAARLLNMPAVMVMPKDAPAMKRARTEALGATIVPYDRDTDSREEIGRRIARERGATLVPPFDDPFVIAGQGTVGLEIMQDLAALGVKPDMVLAGASGGGLCAGLALAIKARSPGTQIFTCEPEGFDDFARSLRSGRRETNARTSGSICDALMAPTPGELTFAILQEAGARGLAASDQEVARAIAFAFHELKLVVEPGGAIALACLLAGRVEVKNRIAVAVLSGGNIDAGLYAKLIETPFN